MDAIGEALAYLLAELLKVILIAVFSFLIWGTIRLLGACLRWVWDLENTSFEEFLLMDGNGWRGLAMVVLTIAFIYIP